MPAAGLTLLVAGAGFGKTTALAQWAERAPCAWHICSAEDAAGARLARGLVDALRPFVPDLPAALVPATEGRGPQGAPDAGLEPSTYTAALAGALDERLSGPLTLVLDDAHELGADGPAVALVEALVRAAPLRLRLVLASRLPPPFPVERLRAQGRLLEVEGAELAFSLDEVEALLAEVLGDPGSLAPGLHAATGGWPAAVRLAAEHLRSVPADQRGAALDRLLATKGPLLEHLGAQVLEGQPDGVRSLLRRVAPLRSFSAALCTALAVPRADELVGTLTQSGLLLAPVSESHDGDLQLSPLVRGLVLDRDPLPPPERTRVLSAVATWLASAGRLAEAVDCLLDAELRDEVATLLATSGAALLAGGGARTVLATATAMPGALDQPVLRRLRAEAHQVCGEWDEARALYATLAEEGGPLPAALAWRFGSLYQLQGRLPEALAVYERAVTDGAAADQAQLAAWTATARWRQGDVAACSAAVGLALASATDSGDPAALSAAHTAAAMLAALVGDRAGNDHHYLLALDAAARAGDVLALIRIRTNRSSHFLDEGAYAVAVDEATRAVELGEASGVSVFRVIALANRAEGAFGLGRVEEAVADAEAARALCQRLGSYDLAYPLLRLGEAYAERGDRSLAAASYREALRLAEAVDDLQALVPALAGLAGTLGDEDPGEALALAKRAVGYGPGMGHVGALLALAAAQLAGDDAPAAAETAHLALGEAGQRRDRPGMARALELRAAASPDALRAVDWLREAVALWRALNSPLGLARAQLALASATGGLEGRMLADAAAAALRTLGARVHADAAERLLSDLDRVAPLAIQTLGGFRVLRAGVPVATSEWQSRKARDLLKVLVVRRGHPIAREALMGVLWPGEAPVRLGNRLSVQLSILRAVLDPQHVHPPDRFIAADGMLVRLELSTVAVDVEAFLSTAESGLSRMSAGDVPAAASMLARAEAAYAGDFLEEDAYEDWASGLRSEARATYVDVARALALARASTGDDDDAARLYRRILERDPYDEPAHLALVASLLHARRHGEARRCHATYTAAMAELGIEPTPFAAGRPGGQGPISGQKRPPPGVVTTAE